MTDPIIVAAKRYEAARDQLSNVGRNLALGFGHPDDVSNCRRNVRAMSLDLRGAMLDAGVEMRTAGPLPESERAVPGSRYGYPPIIRDALGRPVDVG
jgi:hypothetical protein